MSPALAGGFLIIGPPLEGLVLQLKFQYFGHLMQRTDSLEKTLMLGNTESEEKWVTEDEIVGWHHRLSGLMCVCVLVA